MQIVRLQLNEKPDKINELILKTNVNEGRTWWHIIVILGLCFVLTDWLWFVEGFRLKLYVLVCPRSRGWKNIGRRKTKRLGGLENWTIFMDVICVSSLTHLTNSVDLALNDLCYEYCQDGVCWNSFIKKLGAQTKLK